MPRQNSAPRLQAALDLARRYGAAFVHAWRERRRLDPPSRLPFEAQFLPATLELQETPAPAAPRVAAGLIIAFALIALLWAVFGRIDVVATARGRIVPSDRTKIIQPFETATVKAIRVSEGQSVAAGDVLLELDATQAAADTARLSHDLAGARLQSGRAQALLAAIESGRTPVLGAPTGVSPERLAGEQRLLEGEYAEFRAKLARIDAEVARREAEISLRPARSCASWSKPCRSPFNVPATSRNWWRSSSYRSTATWKRSRSASSSRRISPPSAPG